MFRTSALMISGLAVLTGLQGCLLGTDSNRTATNHSDGSASLRLQLRPAALMRAAAGGGTSGVDSAGAGASIDSVFLVITAEDMDTLTLGVSGDSLNVNVEELPPGNNRMVSADLFCRGRRLYTGSATCEFRRESRLDLSLPCRPLFASVSASFHLPIGLPRPIVSGRLALSGKSGIFSEPLGIRDEFASVNVKNVPGGEAYDVSLVLSDSAGKTLYESDRSGVVLPQGEVVRLDLSLLPSTASAALSLALEAAPGDRVEADFPARRRAPTAFGEIAITDFYPAPSVKDSSSEAEWFALFNRTADTLDLSGCRFGRDRTLGVTHAFSFAADQFLAPGRVMTFGRSAANVEVHYADFQMTNSGGSLLLLGRDGALVDSLRYSTVGADSLTALPSKEGWVTNLDQYALGRRSDPSGWCLTHVSPDSHAQSLLGGDCAGLMEPLLK